ncbi:YcjX family protein [Colwellia sp. 20A7]|nr:YcjX family protein [Colwellia sp. 20A7]
MTIPRFDYDKAITSLTNELPTWPEPTHGISELRLAIRYQPPEIIIKVCS